MLASTQSQPAALISAPIFKAGSILAVKFGVDTLRKNLFVSKDQLGGTLRSILIALCYSLLWD